MSNRIPWCLVRTVNVGADYSLNVAPVKAHQPIEIGLPPYSRGNAYRKCYTALRRAFDVICYPRSILQSVECSPPRQFTDTEFANVIGVRRELVTEIY